MLKNGEQVTADVVVGADGNGAFFSPKAAMILIMCVVNRTLVKH